MGKKIQSKKSSSFVQHLERSKKVVNEWPEWKKTIFGSQKNNSCVKATPCGCKA